MVNVEMSGKQQAQSIAKKKDGKYTAKKIAGHTKATMKDSYTDWQ